VDHKRVIYRSEKPKKGIVSFVGTRIVTIIIAIEIIVII
jgi:hypothetical protein